MLPSDGRFTPEIVLSVVVLPAPFPPISVTSSPSPTSKEIPLTASIPPYRTRISFSSRNDPLRILVPRFRGPSTKVRLDDSRIPLDLGRLALGDLLPVVEDGYPIRDPHNHLHVVLDDEDGHAFVSDP